MTGEHGVPNDSGSIIKIEPVSFRDKDRRPRPRSFLKWVAWVAILFLICLVALSAWYVFTAKQVVIQIDPKPDRVSLGGSMVAPKLGSYYLLRPGKYLLKALKACYHPLEEELTISNETSQTVNFTMAKLPGLITFQVHEEGNPSVAPADARVYVDGKELGTAPLKEVAIEAGDRSLEIRAPEYQELRTVLAVEGCRKLQSFNIALVPAWAEVTLVSLPAGADVRLDGDPEGRTPLRVRMMPGSHELKISAEGYKTWERDLEVPSNDPIVLDDIRLLPADGTLVLRTTPAGADVTVDSRYAGKTPFEIPLRPDVTYTIRISKAGYEMVSRKVKVSSNKVSTITVALTVKEGILYFKVKPADAELLVDGEPMGSVPPELRLPAKAHRLEIRKEGYETFRTVATPRPGFPQEVTVALVKETPASTAPPAWITASNGYRLKRITPGSFTMGASRREQGRRANETLREVTLKRPFYMGRREVTNKEFREFLAEHHSGSFREQSLDRDDLPVVQITWEQAALFCNWLGAKESLSPFYVREGDTLVAAEPLTTGYRLPTEAEWEYCARFGGNKASLKYPWGDRFPPRPKSGNFADVSAKDLLPNILESYNDGYPVTAPPMTFQANALELYDLGGNVAEWCHDYYSIYPYAPGKIDVDPLGPTEGKHRLIKGSSWKDSSISELRLSYRSYGSEKRFDVGFRICRYAEEMERTH